MSAPSENKRGFPKASRLLKRANFVEMARQKYANHVKVLANSFIIIGRNNQTGRHRLGVTVTKKTGSAVTRNRLKRQVREFFRLNHQDWPGALDLIFIASHKAGKLSPTQVADDLARAGRKLAALAPSPPPGDTNFTSGGADIVISESQEDSRPRWGLGQICNHLALGVIWFYRRFISPMLPPCCRFWPTCSAYGADAFTIHGFWRGCWLTTRRLLKCHPWHPGGYDPVPPAKQTRSVNTKKLHN